MGKFEFIDGNGTFTMERPENYSGLYFPVAQNMGIKSAVTPNLGGDCKHDQNTFLLEPVSIENLNNNRGVRNFWCKVTGEGVWSAVGASAKQEYEKFSEKQDESTITAGFMWQCMTRKSAEFGLRAEVLTFAPLKFPVEVLFVTLTNTGNEEKEIRPTAAIPLFARSADNIRDHRHVTSLLHRISTTEEGVLVKPTLSFDERGHRKNQVTYYVCGMTGTGEKPVDFYPVMDTFMGEGGTLTNPRTVTEDRDGVPAGTSVEGKEALGGLHFAKKVLKPGESVSYTVIMGLTENADTIADVIGQFGTADKVLASFEEAKNYWTDAVNVNYRTGSREFDGFMKWVSFQPFLRRVFGCSFLPHHDYGRGGRGWRDLWQDCLSLLIMDPDGVRQMIVDNYGGVRIDGTNATIIGEKQGQFIADRNGIARVWMDHGVWPFMTTLLYIHQTGDADVLKENAAYFKDEQAERGTALDKLWDEEYGVCQKTAAGEVYRGTILEHILLEHLCSFYEVGEHNHIRLRGADWNDALDMAAQNGESVAFTCAYAGNMSDLAALLRTLARDYGWKEVELLEEMALLLLENQAVFDSADKKKAQLAQFLKTCGHTVSGRKITVRVDELASNLENKANWIKEHIRATEWIDGSENGEKLGWFNSYYDNHAQRVEGYFPGGVRMMLTGQVFSVMSDTASAEQVAMICKSADAYLYREEVGGYRLNTDFHEEKFDLGRMFGFAYGEKENGAVFSHMTVMYANALYRRGFVKEGYKALQTLANHAMDFDSSRIYPGIPEYFDAEGRGLYHYLTGAASWYMLTFITEVFGAKGTMGDLTVSPRLVAAQFDEQGEAMLSMKFGGKVFEITVRNPGRKEYGAYKVASAKIDGNELAVTDTTAILAKNALAALSDGVHQLVVNLE